MPAFLSRTHTYSTRRTLNQLEEKLQKAASRVDNRSRDSSEDKIQVHEIQVDVDKNSEVGNLQELENSGKVWFSVHFIFFKC